MEPIEAKAGTGEVQAAVDNEPALPKKIKMTAIWSYFDAKKQHHQWNAGQIVDDPDEIRQIVHDCKFAGFKILE